MADKELNQDIYSMKLHEEIYFPDDNYYIHRVPGGWNYVYLDEGVGGLSAVFVPYSSEFSNGIKKK